MEITVMRFNGLMKDWVRAAGHLYIHLWSKDTRALQSLPIQDRCNCQSTIVTEP